MYNQIFNVIELLNVIVDLLNGTIIFLRLFNASDVLVHLYIFFLPFSFREKNIIYLFGL